MAQIVSSIPSDPTLQTLINGIQETAYRQSAYAYNIANASTPGFTPIQFPNELERAKQRHGLEAEKFSIDDEMPKIAKNNLKHSALVKILSAKYSILRKAATQGKG